MKSKNKSLKNICSVAASGFIAVTVSSCSPVSTMKPSIPALEYADRMRVGGGAQGAQVGDQSSFAPVGGQIAQSPEARAQVRFAQATDTDMNSALDTAPKEEISGVQMYRASAPMVRDYQGPLSFGDPGVQASLWKESRSANDMLRDDRAWQSGDLITILVTEKDQGSRQAKTDTKSETTLGAALSNFLGISELLGKKNDGLVDTDSLIKGSSTNEFKGEGKTDRKNSLTAKLSAMVAEVLPTGILRIEGKKIVAVNDEEQIMVISGLVRPRDINSSNEIDSSKIANMRIDYYGKGTVDEASSPGWGTRLIKSVWPF